MAEALYRKYRPQIFEDVVGQEHIERTIKNAVEQDKVSHAYLFTGPRGTGKTTTARLLAKALLCQKGPTAEPDGSCEDCIAVANGNHPDVYELDAASRTGVENVREEIIGRVQFAPTRGRYKIYIIDEVHMLSTAAFNALLKTLEEPPSHVVFILATTDPQKVPETIHSRCQRFDFRRISSDSIVSRLGAICVAEGVEFEGEALELIAHRAEGGMRNALTSLEQLIAFGGGKVTMEVAERMLGSLDSSDLAEIVRFVGVRDVASCFRWTAEFVETGADLAQFTRDFAEHVRNMYVMSLAGADVALDVSESARRELAEELKLFGPDRLARLLGVLGDLSAELKTSTNPRLSFEIALTRMVRPESDLTMEALAERIEKLEQSGVAVAVAPAYAAQPAAQVQPAAERAQRPANQGVQQHVQAKAQPCVQQAVSQQGAAALHVAPAEDAVMNAGSSAAAASVNASAKAGVLPAQLVENMRNAAALQRLWQSVLAQLKKAKAAYGVLFLNTKAVFDEASQALVIEFPAENDFAFKAVQKPDVQDELARAIVQACGVPVAHSMTKQGASAVSGASAVASAVAGSAAAASAAAKSERAAQVERKPMVVQQPAAQSAPSAGRQAASQPSAVVTERPRAAQPASQQSYDYDAVPLEAYDDVVPYSDDAYFEEPGYYADPAPRAQQVQPAQPASSEPSIADLDAMLAFGFGEGVEFREV